MDSIQKKTTPEKASPCSLYKNAENLVSARVEDLLEQMTLREKLGQLTQLFAGGNLEDCNPESDAESISKGEVSSYIWAHFNAPLRNRIQRFAMEDSRLGIPIIFGMDIIHGNRTTFPIPLGLSCAFEPELFEQAQTIAARESAAEGIDWVFTPMCDLSRDIRWGRVAETCGEDPYLNSLCTSAQVRGLQGEDPSAKDRVAACLKHFVGYGASQGGRDYNETEITEWTLRNGHLPPFKAGVESNACTIMSSFNAIGGIPAVANHHTLTEILRDEWGFKGFVVSDWNAVREMISWGYASDRADAASLALAAGNDMDMLTTSYLDTLEHEVAEGRFDLAHVNLAVRRVLSVKFELGLFDQPYVDEANWNPEALTADGIAVAKETATKSVVLLKNEAVLPLQPEVKKVGLIGPFGDDPLEMLGCWSARGRPGDVITLADGLKAALPDDASLSVCQGCAINTLPRTKTLQDGQIVLDEDAPHSSSDLHIDEAVTLAKSMDVVVMALGEPRGWTGELGSRAYLGLTGNQQKLFNAVAQTETPIITVLFSGRPLIVNEVLDESAAVLCAWQPGIRGGEAIAELLTGKAAPSGRLTISVPHTVGQVPMYYNRPKTGRPENRNYRDLETVNPRFHFGFGLTYTSFNYSEVSLDKSSKGIAQASVTITNMGGRAGTETVQMYVRQLACHSGARPEQELRGFKRAELQSGESARVSFDLDNSALGFTNLKGEWQVDQGNYHIWIAPHAHSGEPATYAH